MENGCIERAIDYGNTYGFNKGAFVSDLVYHHSFYKVPKLARKRNTCSSLELMLTVKKFIVKLL